MPTPPATEQNARRDILAEVERTMQLLQAHPDSAVRAAVATMLEGIDAVHRAGLAHLVEALHALGGDTLVKKLIADPAIRMLLMSYDLIAVDRRLQAEEALDTVRGHLHEHGVDVEIQDVVGGVVYARVHRAPGAEANALPLDRVRADLEAALSEFLLGFQELELKDRATTPPVSAVVPLAALRRALRPVYYDALAVEDVGEGTLRAAMVGDLSLLFARVGGDVYAIRNQCGESPLPLEHGTLEGAELRCVWHGCRYDVRSGRRLDAEGRVQVFPVAVADGRIRVACDVAPGDRP